MRLPTLAPLLISLSLVTLSAEPAAAFSKKLNVNRPNPWTRHRAAMEWWIRWPKADDRGLGLETLPACIRDCVTDRTSDITIRGEKVDARTVNRRVFCDPRLRLIRRYFRTVLGSCSLESCRYEHSLWRLRKHFQLWLKNLCRPPGIKKPRNKWVIGPKVVTSIWKLMKPMIDPAVNNTDVPADNDAYDDTDWDAYKDVDWDAYKDDDWDASDWDDYDWGVYKDVDWDAYKDDDGYAYDDDYWDAYDDVDWDASTTIGPTTNATRAASL